MRPAALLSVLLALAPGAPAGEEEPAASRLDDANREAARRVLRTVAPEDGALKNRLRGLRKEDVIVVGGLFDFVQEILVAYRCPHTVIRPSELEHLPLAPAGRKVFLLNCHLLDRSFPDGIPPGDPPGDKEAAANLARVLKEAGLDGPEAPGEAIRKRFSEVKFFAGSDYSVAGLRRLGRAVQDGAWVFSTDWAVLAVEVALPGTVRWTGHTTFEETIEVRPAATGRRHPLLEGAFPETGAARWWLETEAYLFAVRGPHTLLVESRALGARYGGNRNVVVLVEPGQGRLLHALSHSYLQRGTADDMAVMQRMLLNFLIGKSVENHQREWAATERERSGG